MKATGHGIKSHKEEEGKVKESMSQKFSKMTLVDVEAISCLIRAGHYLPLSNSLCDTKRFSRHQMKKVQQRLRRSFEALLKKVALPRLSWRIKSRKEKFLEIVLTLERREIWWHFPPLPLPPARSLLILPVFSFSPPPICFGQLCLAKNAVTVGSLLPKSSKKLLCF